jgi:hypothetical protein
MRCPLRHAAKAIKSYFGELHLSALEILFNAFIFCAVNGLYEGSEIIA